MGGEGSMMSVNSSLKNNRNLLSKKREKGGLSGSYSNFELKEFPKATPKQLEEIREQMKKENNKNRIVWLFMFGMFFLILFLCLYI